MKKILLVTMACAGLCACSSDDIDLGTSQKVFEGDQAYMTVRLCDVGSSTRATAPTTGSEWENGTDGTNSTVNEMGVNDAYFYFYDESGEFVSKGEVWNDGSAVSGNGNVEFKSNTVVILKGLTNMNYPKYVVTVLNKPADFVEPVIGNNLEDMKSLLADENGVGIMQNESSKSGFTMSTSSYYDNSTDATTGNLIRDYDFVTMVDESNFSDEPIEEELSNLTNAVDIYVERLASKVTLKVGGLTNETIDISVEDAADSKAHTLYAIEESVAGYDNDDEVETDGGNEAVDKIYVELEGWKLNATARNSNIVKAIEDKWTNDENSSSSEYYLGKDWSWNDAGHFRSYWGKSFNYGKTDADYPDSSTGNESGDEASSSTKKLNKYLKYVNLESTTDSPLLGLGDNGYCAENTNTAGGEDGIIQSKYSSAITSVLLKAKVCDENAKGLDLVRYNGLLFTNEAYINYILNHLQTTGQLNVYYVGTDGNMTQIDASCVKLLDTMDGKVTIDLDFGSGTATTYYEYAQNEETGEYEYNEINSENDYVIFSTVANAYAGGEMYYTIPIEHLNDNYGDVPQEANYGIVRNHHYVVTINKLENLGKGIFDPKEVIVPNPDEQDDLDTTYYIGADINILSWKLVEQSVDL